MAGVVQSWVTTQARIGTAPEGNGVAGWAEERGMRRDSLGKPSESGSVKRMAEMADGPVGSLETHRPPAGTWGGAGKVAVPVWLRHHTPVSSLSTAYAEGAVKAQRLAVVPD